MSNLLNEISKLKLKIADLEAKLNYHKSENKELIKQPLCMMNDCDNYSQICFECYTGKKCLEPFCSNHAFRCCSCTEQILEEYAESFKESFLKE